MLKDQQLLMMLSWYAIISLLPQERVLRILSQQLSLSAPLAGRNAAAHFCAVQHACQTH
jgi:hypothetical protein